MSLSHHPQTACSRLLLRSASTVPFGHPVIALIVALPDPPPRLHCCDRVASTYTPSLHLSPRLEVVLHNHPTSDITSIPTSPPQSCSTATPSFPTTTQRKKRRIWRETDLARLGLTPASSIPWSTGTRPLLGRLHIYTTGFPQNPGERHLSPLQPRQRSATGRNPRARPPLRATSRMRRSAPL
ncbi:extensin-like [Iris pallida]|uniref:Extensin-like n=1 Tax=Iris pallida TaxID=29817 RepID=A0AAX6FSK4_IRIPA|nr:extensin-like [Iris pallida]